MAPQREVLSRLSRGEFPLIKREAEIFYRDVYDHIVRIEDLNQTTRDRADNALATYLSSVANRQNEVMKVLTIIATIGTFKAFNHIWVMKEDAARDTVKTTSILIYETFRGDGQFGEAAAMAFILFGVILALSQIQNRIGEKLVFYA